MRLNVLSWIVLSCAVLNLNAQNAAPKVISVSLEEAVRRAVQQNLAIRLGGLTPQIAQIRVEGAYGGYDPILEAQAGQNYNNNPGSVNPAAGGGVVPGSRTWRENYSLDIRGSLPTGTRYELSSSLGRLSGERFNDTSSTFNNIPFQYSSDVGISVTQPILKDFWIDQTRLTIQLRKKDLAISHLDLEFTFMDVVHEVSQAYYDLIAAREQVKVREMAVQLKEQNLSETRKKVQAGTFAPLDEKQAESEAATAKADLIQARSDAEIAENVLKRIISGDLATILDVTIEPSEKLVAVTQVFNVVECMRTALEMRPDYLRRKQQLEQENIQLKFNQNQLYPALDLVGTYGRNGLGGTTRDSLDTIADNRFPRWGGGVVLTVPLSRRAERAAYKEQKINVQAALLTLKATEQDVIREVDDAVKKVRSTLAAIDSTREARVFAEAALDAEQKKLENGKSTNFQVLELQDRLTQARAAEIEAVTSYNKALHDLYFREGTTLKRAKVQVEVK